MEVIEGVEVVITVWRVTAVDTVGQCGSSGSLASAWGDVAAAREVAILGEGEPGERESGGILLGPSRVAGCCARSHPHIPPARYLLPCFHSHLLLTISL